MRRRRLKRCHIEQLRARIAQLQTVGADGRFQRLALHSLRIADTQLKEIAVRSGGTVFDEQGLRALPQGVKKRILLRLENVAARLAAAHEAAVHGEGRDPAFRCVRDYERCCREARGARFWCHIAMVVCLAGSMLRR
ncbi:MAG TPA: hypothetical protein VNK52_02105 [Hyphomicrobiaceae bacterium]|nr:hypothetical protein [Hyphomicrobiaceae bacterium]